MPNVTATYWAEEWSVRVNSWAPYVDDFGDAVDASIDICFDDEQSLQSAKLGDFTLDEAEQFARKVLDAVMDARMGRFTHSMGS